MTAHASPIESGADAGGERNQVKLGRYEIVRELGKGAMGIVYLAKDPLIGRLVALKTIRPSAHADDEDTREFQARFVREAQAAGILNHPAIVTVHDIGQDEPSGMSFIAMEYVEGQNLKEMLAQGRPLSFEQAADIIAQVAEGLDFAHAKGIVHRDVKPANIILLEGNRAKITDFGIAKITSGVANLTTTGQFLGTPNYMAPEQIKGTPVDGRSDIFSLGICLYECLTHRKPFGGDSLTSISYKIVHEPFPPLQEINPTIPEGYGVVVSQCLEKDPSKRYQRGKDVANALRAVLRGERPVRSSDPMFADATVLTRGDHDKLPTMEIPFPEADAPGKPQESLPPLDTNPTPAVTRQPAVPSSAVKAFKPPKPAGPPIWKQRIDPILFFAIAGLLLASLVVLMVVMSAKKVSVPVVDKVAEAKVAKERSLREEASRLVSAGRVPDAYARYEQLLKLAPHSPATIAMMQKLSQTLQKDEAGRYQIAMTQQLAQQKFDEGLVLFNQKKFAESIPLFEESFHLNPSPDRTAQYLKLAQQEDQRVKSERAATRVARTSTEPHPAQTATSIPVRQVTATHPIQPVPQTPAAPASLTTVFNSTVSDGSIIVKVGVDTVANEQLWYERRIIHTHAPHSVNVTKEFPAKNADLEVWLVIPTLSVKEYHKLTAQKFEPGVNHRLVVTFDPKSKKVDYQFN
ncbi:MAG TPA: serine/threonine-protein kinase [Thermoanaerobaculia bacterium]|nr:serine/threonine-protein kinase [Thermoanaerobaculia bacterium]